MKWFKCKRCFKIFCSFANILLHIPDKMGDQVKKNFESTVFNLHNVSLKLKNITLLLPWDLLILFHMVIFTTTFPNIVKINVENDNVVFALSIVVQINVEANNIDSTLFNVINSNVEIDNVDSTLFDVLKSNVDIPSVVSMLIWCCAMSRRHINLKTASKQQMFSG